MVGFFAAYGIAWRSILGFTLFESLPVYLVLAFLIAFQNSLPYLADRLLAPRLNGFASTLLFPLAVTAIWFIYNLASPLGSFGTTGYEQYTNLALIQLVSVTGMWGLTFLVSWLGPVANWAWERSFNWPDVRRGLLVFAAVAGSVLLFGSLRRALARPEAGTVRIHGLTPQRAEGGKSVDFTTNLESARRYMQVKNEALIADSVREARRGAQIVLWGEMAGGGVEEDANALIARGQEVARQENIYLAMGVGIIFPGEERRPENRLVVVAPSGEIVLNHLKYGAPMISPIGVLQPGDGVLQTADTPYGTLSGIICWDGNFPIVVKQAGRKQVDILLVAHGEQLEAAARLHEIQHTFRAIENGVSGACHDNDIGISFAADPYGRRLAANDNYRAAEKVIVAQVPTRRVLTLYPVIGDLFGWLAVAGFVAIAVWAIIQGCKAKRAD